MNTLRDIHQAYKTGAKGEPLHITTDKSPSRIKRLAHKMGSSSFSRQERMIAAYETEAQERVAADFAETLAHAQGLNKDILLVLEAAAAIPRKTNKPPLEGNRWREDRRDSGYAQKRDLMLTSGFEDAKHGLPISGGLGSLDIDSIKWQSADMLTVPVDYLSVSSLAHKTPDGQLTSVTSSLQINNLEYDPENPHPETGNRFKGSMSIDVDDSGRIVKFGMARAGQTGYTMEDPALMQIDLGKFLQGVRQSVEQEVEAQ